MKKGTHPKTSGTIAPLTPIEVPTIILVKGMRKIRRMRKGIERKKLVIRFRMKNTTLFSHSPPFSVTVSVTPMNSPSAKAMMPAMKNMRKVAVTLSVNLFQ